MKTSLFLSLTLIFALMLPVAGQSFPGDFPQIIDGGGNGQGEVLQGFGGNLALDREGNQKAVTKNPVILLHGNGGNASHVQWGMETIRSFLKDSGYNDSEVWAVSYLGANNGSAEMLTPHKNNINDVRRFIDAVREYLDVQKVDIIGHSLGGTMARSYVLGLQNNGSWSADDRRLEAVGTVVTMAAANYGLGMFSVGEWKTGDSFEKKIHYVDGIFDDTPAGSNDLSEQVGNHKGVTELDDDKITYVGVWATGDFVDRQNPGTGKLVGAHLNQSYNLGSSAAGHERIIKDRKVFDDVLPFLNTRTNTPPQPLPPVTSISPESGEFIGRATVRIRATNQPDAIYYDVNGNGWLKYTGSFEVKEDCTIKAKAENKYGTSPEVSVVLTKSPTPPFTKVLGTATQHYLAGRIDNQQYIAFGMQYGYMSPFYLYQIEGSDTWTDKAPE